MPNAEKAPDSLAEDNGTKLTATASAFTALLILFATFRYLSQRTKGRGFGLDDLFSYIGLIFIIGECVIAIVMVPVAGVGHHVAYLEAVAPKKLAHEYIIMFPIEILYISAFTFPKLSILAFYLKIFVTKISRNITYFLIGIMVATWIAETFSAIFQCWPVEYIWDKSIEGGHCVNQNALFQFWSVPNIATDTAMLVLPMPTIWNLQMSKIQKLGLTFTFMLGSIGLIASCVRFAIFSKTAALKDATWASVELQSWTIVEPSMYFFAGILPTLRPIVSLIVVKVKTMVSSTKPYQSSKEVGTYGMYGKERRNMPGNKQSKNWSPLHDNNNQHGDSFALVEYTQNITSGEDDVMAVDHKKIDQGIRRTQEVVVTRDTI